MLQALDAAAVRRWAAAAVAGLSAVAGELNRINVFPVADADTGTNLLLTMRSAVDALSGEPRDELAAVTAALARGALAGAQGNSGLVLAACLRGVAETCRDADTVPAEPTALLRRALDRCAELARAAFVEPVDGTALSVLDAAASAARITADGGVGVMAKAAVDAATDALARTPSQLPVLARAGVVDAGGRGILVVLETVVRAFAGPGVTGVAPPLTAVSPRPADLLVAARESGSPEYDYEVMYLLDQSTDDQVAALRADLAGLGDSVAVVGDGAGTWHVHVHCADIGAAVEAGVRAGRPHRITVIRFADQLDQVGPPAPPRLRTERAVVAMVAGDGAQQLFRGEGAAVAPAGSTPDELLATITGTGAAHVVVLPNTAEATAGAAAAAAQARAAGQDVVVVPTSSPVQGLAALAVHDPARRADDDTVAMAEAAAATRSGELTVATEEALTWAGRCQPGDVLGLVDGEVVCIETDVAAAAAALVELMVSTGGEVVTALVGASAPSGLAATLARRLHDTHPEVELTVYPGGQVGSPLLVGVE